MSIINRVPRGLQSLLDSKSLGVNPTELLQTVSPTVDLSAWWYADKPLNGTSSAIVAGAIGTQATVTVPSGELWGVQNVTGEYLSAAAGNYPTFRIRYRGGFASNIANTLAQFHMIKLGGGDQANELYACAHTFPVPTLFGPGTNFDIFNAVAVNVGSTFTVRVAYYQLSI